MGRESQNVLYLGFIDKVPDGQAGSLRAFVKVVQHGGLSAAARDLRLSRSGGRTAQ
jgi:hypothetical protein